MSEEDVEYIMPLEPLRGAEDVNKFMDPKNQKALTAHNKYTL